MTNVAYEALTLTPAAADHVRRYLAREGARALRLTLTRTGCSGWAHEVSLVDDYDAEADVVFEDQGIALVVDGEVIDKVAGTEIDFVTQGLNRVFVFANPQAGEACGCGESFTLQEADESA
ncbi:MAG: iron-sulfur cluster assembly accessory protein [Pseudomonadota bacterium]